MRINERVTRRDLIFKLAAERRNQHTESKTSREYTAYILRFALARRQKRKQTFVGAKCFQNATAKSCQKCCKMICGKCVA